jgi:hypothetical protein
LDEFLSLISQDVVCADTPQLDLVFSKSQGQVVSLADTNFKFIRSTQFFQSQGRMAKILKQQIQLFIDAIPDIGWQFPVIF